MNNLLIQQYPDRMLDRHPGKIAVTDGNSSLSYYDLEILSNRLANGLRAQGVNTQDRVVFCMRRSVESLVVILGILKADAIYIPIDSKAPIDRWESIFLDSSPAAIICDTHNSHDVQLLSNKIDINPKIFTLDSDLESTENSISWVLSDGSQPFYDDSRPAYCNCPSDIAYILYTSGSTGTPKGVMISHENIHDYIDWAVRYFQIEVNDNILGTAPFHFDMSTFDIFCTLRTGSTLFVAKDELLLFPMKLVDFIDRHKITLWKGISSLLMYIAISKSLAKGNMASLKKVIFAGEKLSTKYLKEWMSAYPGIAFYNAYGPTEATGISLCYHVEQMPNSSQDIIPIGKPCEGTQVFLCDDYGLPIDHGQTGELCLGGKGLAEGYLNDPHKTEKAFIELELNGNRQRFYKTGDLAKFLPCGNYQFVGRKDRQLKFMGYRIEAGDVEHAILSINGVKDAAVKLLESKINSGVMELVAFIETSDDFDVFEDLKSLKNSLPIYMIPKRYSKVAKMPRCSRGKIKYDSLGI